MGHAAISTSGISLRVTTHDEFADHAWDAQQQYTGKVDKDKGCATILTCHEGEAPHIAQTNSRACRRQHNRQFASEIASIGGHSSPN